MSSEVQPFVPTSEIASIARHLPQKLHDLGGYEVRIMMPRYGTISERRNRLHEVIRLSGTPIKMGKKSEVLKVKVASIPGIRLQVYFMDNVHFFKRKGLHQDKQGVIFEDNVARSLFFSRAVAQTIVKFGWKPDVVHAMGWVSGCLPMLLADEEAYDGFFKGTRVIYTPDSVDAQAALTDDLISTLSIPTNGEDSGLSLCDAGVKYADATAFPSSIDPGNQSGANGYIQFSEDVEPMTQEAIALYGA